MEEYDLDNLLSDVEEQKEDNKLVIDFDGVIYLSAYKYTEQNNPELVYMDCCKRIGRIESEVYKRFELTEILLGLTANTNFRYDIYPEYKANRKQPDEKAKKLSDLVKATKRLIYQRLKPILLCNDKVESDDFCIEYSKRGYIVGAIDSDVVGQSRTPVFNFKQWKWMHDGLEQTEIYENILYDSIKGKSKDNVIGVKGAGEKFAKMFVDKIKGKTFKQTDISRLKVSGKEVLLKDTVTFSDYVSLFDTPELCLLNYQLCDCSQYDGKEIKLIDMIELSEIFNIIGGK
jgi:hypothetical protein